MHSLVAALTVAAVLTTTSASPASAPAPPAVITLDGVAVQLDAGTHQVITVNRTSGTHARITLWALAADGRWVSREQSRSARIGYGGLVVGTQRHQGSGTTPVGTYPLLFTFGTLRRRPSWSMRYLRIKPHDYWVEDNRSPFYNRYRSRDAGGFRYWLTPRSVDGSERLARYRREYQLSVVIGFNYDHPVPYRGAGIFLHVNGRGATAGCVSAPRFFLRATFRWLNPGLHPVIAIGR